MTELSCVSFSWNAVWRENFGRGSIGCVALEVSQIAKSDYSLYIEGTTHSIPNSASLPREGEP
jgi:hypothetical protein